MPRAIPQYPAVKTRVRELVMRDIHDETAKAKPCMCSVIKLWMTGAADICDFPTSDIQYQSTKQFTGSAASPIWKVTQAVSAVLQARISDGLPAIPCQSV